MPTLSITFDEPVTTGNGIISVRHVSDNTEKENIMANSSQVQGRQTDTLIISPNALDDNSEYYIHIDNLAVMDVM